jgi:glycosyltransferase involved in cell wall biosynthesis
MHDTKEKICLIIPCYNEEKRLHMESFLDRPEHSLFLFVNDGSTDKTAGLITKYLNNEIFLLDLKQNVGKAEAVRLGMLYACLDAPLNESEWIGFWDADLATPLSEIRGFLNFADIHDEEVDAIWGSRVYRLGSSIRRSYLRHILGRFFATMAALILGIESYDSQCGAKLFKRKIIKLAFSEKFISRWIFDIELLLRLKHHTVIEYPLQSWSDIAGSKLNFIPNAVSVLNDLIRIRKKYGRIHNSSNGYPT